MKKENKLYLDILLRYLILLVCAFPNLAIFYFIFTPLTIYAVYFMLSFFFPVSLLGNTIIIGEFFFVSMIPACIAGAGYYLLLILNLSLPKIKFSKRILLILIAFFSLLVINVLRIFFLSIIYFYYLSFADFAHKFFWYVGGIFSTVGIWFLEVYFFKIKEIPFYSDLKFLYRKSFFSKK